MQILPNSFANSFRTLGCSSSGLKALERFRPLRSFVTPSYKIKTTNLHIQVNLIITLSLGSLKTDRVISEQCYNEVIYNRHIAK